MSGLHPQSATTGYSDYQQATGVWIDGSDPTLIQNKGSRSRRKSAPGAEHVKHRRTRSGCYTCRARRVKCDETHPICERCKKGGRDCVYSEPAKLKKLASGGSTTQAGQPSIHESPSSSTDDSEENEDVAEHLDVIPAGDEADPDDQHSQSPSKLGSHSETSSQTLHDLKTSTRPSPETASLVQDTGLSPPSSTEGLSGNPAPTGAGMSKLKNKQSINLSSSSNGLRNDWTHLAQDLQFYLDYFCKNITPYHYTLKLGSGDFLRTHFLEAALRNDALLYAIVGFSAFQRTLHTVDGKIQDFLPYYNKAVSLLLKSLRRGERHNTGTLLAMLQLATIEEFLGDWINLLGHQKAAYEILTELYTPQTIMQTEVSRIILAWYARFDVFAGLMGGFETVLPREWFSGSSDYYMQKMKEEPANVAWKIEQAAATVRLLAMDMSMLFAKMGKEEMPLEQFHAENEELRDRISEWKDKMDTTLKD